MDTSPLPTQVLLTHRLPNGLHVVGQFMPEAESVSLAFYVRTGARDELDPALEGISHFLEHLLFKGTQQMNRQQLDQAFTRIGARRNGYTSLERTFYYAHVVGDYGARALELLSAMMYLRLLPDEFEAEKEVILNEIARSEDQPVRFAQRRMMRAYFGELSLGNNVLGSRETIRAMQLEQVRAYWQQRYGAENMILSIAGKFVWEELISLAERLCGEWPARQGGRLAPPYEPMQKSTHVIVDPQRKQQLFLLAMPMLARESADYAAAVLGTSVLGRRRGSRVYWSIVQQGLAASASASLWALEGTGLLLLTANVLPSNARHVLQALRAELNELLSGGLTEDELQRAKAFWINELVLSAEHPYPQMGTLAHDWMVEGCLVPLDEKVARVQAVTGEEILRVFRSFPLREKQVLTAYGPLTEQEIDA